MEAYSLCCLLPCIVFLTLLAQLYCHAPPKKGLLRGGLHLLNDDLLCSIQGLITITELPPPTPLMHPCPSDKHPKHSPSPVPPPNEPASCGGSRGGAGGVRRETLTGCSAGLARMKLINQRYLASRGSAGELACVGKGRGGRRVGKEGFRPTCLPPIVEGLQY